MLQMEGHLVRTHFRTHPVVQVVMKACVINAELELLQKTAVIHHVEGRENITTFLLAGQKG